MPPPPPSTPTPTTSRNSLFDVNTSSWSPEPAPRLSTTPRRTTPYRAASRSPPPPLYRQYQATTPPPAFVSPPPSPLGPAPGMAPAPTPAPPGSTAVLGVADPTMKAAHRLSGEYYASPPLPPPPAPVASGSKTSSFFASAAADTPPPPPRLSVPPAPSPLTLSRASSLRSRALPSLPSPPPPADPDDCPPSAALSPLHQSPSLPPTSCWLPPRPPAADHIQLRLYPEPTYLLGEGRYACVYLAAYKGLGGGHPHEWTLAAAKRMAPDRESQTMGLREAFFLNRLGAAPAQRATSPLRSTTAGGAARNPRLGRVYVVKLIAVKEDSDGAAAALHAHARSVSDQAADGGPASSSSTNTASSGPPPPGALRRPRSSTVNASNRLQDSGSHANLPQLQGASVGAGVHPSVSPSRLVLVLEHAPLGTLDRLLRTSPGLVGEQLWGRWAREAAEALEWVHSRGVVHADVKPSNLLLTADLHLRLSDFGSSLLVHPSHQPTDGVGLGTLPFSPPELVDPTKPFSFPVDIFALGATLYQCITGREPYRGSRPMEMRHHVRNGALWVWEENQRLNRIGTTGTNTPALGTGAGGSPYPSAWRDDFTHVPANDKSLLRTGSLRVPMGGSNNSNGARGSILPGSSSGTTPFGAAPLERPGLNRVGSAESLKASEDVIAADSSVGSPSAVKLWHKWVKSADERGGGAHHVRCAPIERLLRPDDAPPSPPTSPIVGSPGGAAGVSRSSSLRSAVSVSRAPSIRSPKFRHAPSHSNGSNNGHHQHLSPNASPTSSTGAGSSGFVGLSSQTHAALAAAAAASIEPAEAYADGSPAMFFLGDGGGVRVPEDVRRVLRAMLDPVPEMRPTAADVVGAWDQLEVGVGETEND